MPGCGMIRKSARRLPELFFDLVFVFALIQLSHFAAEDFTYTGLLEAAVIALALWWVWIHTAWVTNWLDPSICRSVHCSSA